MLRAISLILLKEDHFNLKFKTHRHRVGLSKTLFDHFQNIPARRRTRARFATRYISKLLHFCREFVAPIVAPVVAMVFALLSQSHLATENSSHFEDEIPDFYLLTTMSKIRNTGISSLYLA